jgi:predicted alpha/beta-fold hydrolase
MPALPDEFRSAWGLRWSHSQSLYGVVARSGLSVPMRRERRETPDGDFVDLDWVDGPAGAPTVIVLHGLEGSSGSGYVQHMLLRVRARGWAALAINARSCSGEPNRQLAAYSSGDTRDLSWLVKSLKGPLYAVGFSLGASVLLNFLARDEAANKILGAAAVSAPFDLAQGAQFLDSGSLISRQYLNFFLPKMKAKLREKAARLGKHFTLSLPAIEAVTRIQDFDALVTAPTFGFASAQEYYARCSTGPVLEKIRTPTLLLSSRDDTLAPPALPQSAHQNHSLDILLTERGGHVGFLGGTLFRPTFWAEDRVAEWLTQTHYRMATKLAGNAGPH